MERVLEASGTWQALHPDGQAQVTGVTLSWVPVSRTDSHQSWDNVC